MFNSEIHHRRSIRLRDFDYSASGAYFVTICTKGREYLFGDIDNGEMVLNDAGRMVAQIWKTVTEKFPEIILGELVIMPNHFHGIVVIGNDMGTTNQGAASGAPTDHTENKYAGRGAACCALSSSAPTLGKIMRAFKSIPAIEVNRVLDRQGQPLWQRNYYERIIRDDNELAAITEYIALNPVRWAEDKENRDSAEMYGS